VESIQDDPRVKAALDHIDKNHDAILREWIAITEINAPSKQEQERAKFIESLLRKHKLTIRYDSAGNLIATRQGTGGGPVTVFDAHMDTVFQPGLKIKAMVRDGRVYAPGIGDDTRNIEALLATIRALDAAKVKTKGDLVFLFTTDEEAGMSGAKQYTKDFGGLASRSSGYRRRVSSCCNECSPLRWEAFTVRPLRFRRTHLSRPLGHLALRLN
jgi:acetylornithine deacetylase/succinyl-diaminopimelate desuccinylase-like protein